ncbi:MAG TPA: pirin family protein [Polyangia bacterium]|nr:pirin family protein [Polyangia bacterium]
MSFGRPDRRQVVKALALGVPAAGLAACRIDNPAAAGPSRPREVAQLIDAQPTLEGAGVRLRRALGSPALPMLDPFLLLDEIHSDDPDDYARGFPTHPHRGFETVTYVLDGAMDHRDSLGNHGHLGPGSVQWMTAGHGIVHAEMPQQEKGRMWGFQLWVNLPAAAKLMRPRYQDIAPARVVQATIDDASVRLVAGEVAGRRGPVEGIVTAPEMLDVSLGARGRLSRPLPPGHNAFVYVIEGSAQIGGARTQVSAGQLAVLGGGELLAVRSERGGRMLCLAARPIREPVARYGPFVMNTDDEIRQAVDDYRSGRLVGG